jgi:hypothetical protein
VEPSELVRAVIDAARAGDIEAAAALFAEDCVLNMPEGTFVGRDGVERLRAKRTADGGPRLSAGDPEGIGESHVLVPLSVDVEIGDLTQTVRATGIWTVLDGRVSSVSFVPGGRRMALATLEREEAAE